MELNSNLQVKKKTEFDLFNKIGIFYIVVFPFILLLQTFSLTPKTERERGRGGRLKEKKTLLGEIVTLYKTKRIKFNQALI